MPRRRRRARDGSQSRAGLWLATPRSWELPRASGVSRRAWSGLARMAYVFYTAPPYGANGLWWAERGLCRHAQQCSTPFALGLTGRGQRDSMVLVDRVAASRSFGRKPGRPLFMHIAFLDESGTHREARYYKVAGLVAFERNIYFLSGGLDAIQAKYFPDCQGRVFFHASSLHAPEKRTPEPFKGLSQQGLFIFTLSVAEGSKVLACIPFFMLEPSPCRVILDSSPSAQNDISR